jgi:hypothetical protein
MAKKKDTRGQWWDKLSTKERSEVAQKAVRTRKRNALKASKERSQIALKAVQTRKQNNQQLEAQLVAIASKLGLKRALAALSG